MFHLIDMYVVFNYFWKINKAKIHFWSLHFGLIFDLVPKLISSLGQSLISENRFYFGPCRQSSNRKCIRGKRNALFADQASSPPLFLQKFGLKLSLSFGFSSDQDLSLSAFSLGLGFDLGLERDGPRSVVVDVDTTEPPLEETETMTEDVESKSESESKSAS